MRRWPNGCCATFPVTQDCPDWAPGREPRDEPVVERNREAVQREPTDLAMQTFSYHDSQKTGLFSTGSRFLLEEAGSEPLRS